jgi:hypothetical protein
MSSFSPSDLAGLGQAWDAPCGPRGGCPPIIIQQGCCPTTGQQLPPQRQAGVIPSSFVGQPRRRPSGYSRPPTVTPGPGPSGLQLTTTPPPAISIPGSPAGAIGTALTSIPAGPAASVALSLPRDTVVPAPDGGIAVGRPAGGASSTGLALPKSFVPAGGFAVPTATAISAGQPIEVSTGTQAPGGPTKFTFPGGWQNAPTGAALPGAGGLDLVAIQNAGRKQAVAGAQGGFLPAASSALSVAGMGAYDADPMFMPRFALGAFGVFLLATGFTQASKSKSKKKSRAGCAKATGGLVALFAATKLRQA